MEANTFRVRRNRRVFYFYFFEVFEDYEISGGYFAAVREQAWLLIDRLRDEVHGGNGQGYAAQAPPPRMPAPRRAREWAAAFGRGSFNASYSFGGAQRDGPFAYRAHAND